MKFSRKSKLELGTLLLCGGIGIYLLVQVITAGLFPRSKLETVVEQIRAESIEPARIHRFRLDGNLSPSSLRPMKGGEIVERGDGRGLVWAELSTERTLRIAFETRDLGHAGESGYLYSDNPVTSADVDELGREWKLGRRISEHWWVIVYDGG